MKRKFFNFFSCFFLLSVPIFAENVLLSPVSSSNNNAIILNNPINNTGKKNNLNNNLSNNTNNLAIKTKKKKVVKINYQNEQSNVSNQEKAQIISRLVITKMPISKIKQMKKTFMNYEKALKSPLNNNIAQIKNVTYYPGQVINISTKVGYSTILEFDTINNNPVQFSYISSGSNVFKYRVFGNKIEIKAFDRYDDSNLIIGIKGYPNPIIFDVHESTGGQFYDAYVRIRLANTFVSKIGSSEDARIKSLILKEIFRYGEIPGLPQMKYEVYSLTDNKYVLFDKDLLKIYKVNKLNHTYYLVLLNTNFKMYGNNGIFATYDNKYYVYLLNFNQDVFTIRTNPDLGVKPEDIERYRIVIDDF